MNYVNSMTNSKLSIPTTESNDQAPEGSNEPISFHSILNMFQYRITCLGTALNMIQTSEYQSITAHAFNIYHKVKNGNYITNEEEIEDGRISYTFSIPENDASTARVVTGHQINIASISHASYIMRRNLIVSLVSEVDNLIAALIKLGFSLYPSTLDSSDKKFSLSELSKFSTISDAKDYLIEKEIETVLRDSHTKQFEYIEKKFNLKDLRKIPGWGNFVEITERRNVFVHCDGIVSRQYISVCQQNKISLPENCKLGVQLDVDAGYFEESYKNILKVGVILTHKIWRQLQPNDRELADGLINDLFLHLILNEDYDLAIELLHFNETNFFDKKTLHRMKMISTINKAQAYKWKKDKAKMNQTLSKLDFSAANDDFKLAELVLKDDFDSAAKLVEKIGSKSEYTTEHSYREWPIFKEFRKSEKFIEAFEIAFNKKFNLSIEDNITLPEDSLEVSNLDESNIEQIESEKVLTSNGARSVD
jgi:hypothetical protein